MTIAEAWPERFDPEKAPVFAHNEIRTSVAAEVLWPILIRVTDWPDWYPHASHIRTVDGASDLEMGSTFSWKTLNVRVKTTVTEFAPAQRLAWSGTAPASRGYHRWILNPTDDGGCLIVTEEVQIGLIPRLMASRLKKDLKDNHQEWLEGLIARGGAATG
jgi:hypothetical protein